MKSSRSAGLRRGSRSGGVNGRAWGMSGSAGRRRGLFRVVLGDKKPADARPSIVYGCHRLTGLPIPEINMSTSNGLGAARLFKPDSPKDKPEVIWMTPPWRVAEINLEIRRQNAS